MKKGSSLRRQMTFIILLCWLLPMILAVTVMGYYLSFGLDRQKEQAIAQQFQLNLQMGADRVDSAVEASRLPSYDPSFQDAWRQYKQDGVYSYLYRRASALFGRLYQSDSRFLYGVFCFAEDPREMAITVVNGSSGLFSNQVRDHWKKDLDAVQELAASLDTAVGFLETDGRVYLVRNLMDSDYQPIGVLALALNLSYYFEDLSLLSWASSVSVCLEPDTWLLMKGDAPPQSGPDALTRQVRGRNCRLSAVAELDYDTLLAGFASYRYLLAAMGLSLLLLLLLTFRFFRRKISQPIDTLMAGAAKIREGALGSQIALKAGSREFDYLTDSFNQMSAQLQLQFTRLYQEELARKDAQIKALQAHINPHFLNNTLEIINWEARMADNEQVSAMIEALSTMLDAALDRGGRTQIPLREEMGYVDAYLYIIQERLGDGFHVYKEIDQTILDQAVPRLILQPIVENAVEHDITARHGGNLWVRAFRRAERMVLEVEHDGAMNEEDQERIRSLLSEDAGEGECGVGLRNVHRRLKLIYGERAVLQIGETESGTILARIDFPAE